MCHAKGKFRDSPENSGALWVKKRMRPDAQEEEEGLKQILFRTQHCEGPALAGNGYRWMSFYKQAVYLMASAEKVTQRNLGPLQHA